MRANGLSEAQACVLAQIGRSSYRYRGHPRDNQALAERLQTYSRRHPREGYRKAHAWLRKQGQAVNHKRVERVWREEHLSVPKPQRRRRRGKSVEPMPHSAEKPNHVWTCDFMEDSCVQGRKLRFLNVMDEFTREGLSAEVSRSFRAEQVAAIFTQLVARHGAPEFIRSDNGPEFVAQAMKKWRENQEVKSVFIEPGKPWQNGRGESFNSRMREECLNMEVFFGVRDARSIVQGWMGYYNEERPHGALDYLSPLEFKRQWLARQSTGAPPPNPRDLSHEGSKQNVERGDASFSAAPSALSSTTALGALPSGALSSVRTFREYDRIDDPATKNIDTGKSSQSGLS